MRVFALSDIHVDYGPNMHWVQALSRYDYVDDMLILAGDVSHKRALLDTCLSALTRRFRRVLFVPGNHDLWVAGEAPEMDSLQKFAAVAETAAACGATLETVRVGELLVVPLLGWYDYSFGEPGEELMSVWMDFRACSWPEGLGPKEVARHFAQCNAMPAIEGARRRITVSHFLPRIDLIPPYVPRKHRMLDPVLGSTLLEEQLRRLAPAIHVYGHSHINRTVELDGVRYVNNAFGYPQENRIAAKQLLCIDEVALP